MTLGDKGYPSTSHKKRLCDVAKASSSLNYPVPCFFHCAAAQVCPFTLSYFLCFSGRIALLSRGNSRVIAFHAASLLRFHAQARTPPSPFGLALSVRIGDCIALPHTPPSPFGLALSVRIGDCIALPQMPPSPFG